MPKDEWRRARDRDHARRAERELATGGLRSYEALSDDVTPLDKINVLTSCPDTYEPEERPTEPPRIVRPFRPGPAATKSSGFPSVVRFSITRGVSVQVKVEAKIRMSIVQALEAALAEARARPELDPPTTPAKATPRKAERKTNPSPSSRPRDLPEPEIVVFRKKLKYVAEAIAASNLLRPAWRKERLGSWLQRVDDAQGPSGFAQLMFLLEANIIEAKESRNSSNTGRRVWRSKCLASKTFQQAQTSLVQLAELFRIR